MRITMKMLESMVQEINATMGTPTEYRNKETGKANIGFHYLGGAYGGYNVNRIVNDDGGVTCPLGHGHVPARELYNKIIAYIDGYNAGRKV